MLDTIVPNAASNQYIGRFAPSPSGALHFGSMVAALGSYLQAKANNGLWLVRIEDIDPPREVKGASGDILRTLEHFGLYWDGDVVYQSSRFEAYQQALSWLESRSLSYFCQCTRKQINQNAQVPGIYQRTCRTLNLNPALINSPCAIRFKNETPALEFTDLLQGTHKADIQAKHFADDFIIHRKDGLFAYQLAVVVDDIAQGITQIVRGSDLLPTTLHQMSLYRAFGQTPPSYLHLPVAVTEPGKKLSKQNHALPVNQDDISHTLILLLQFLGFSQAKKLKGKNQQDILTWAIEHWSIDRITKTREINLDF